MNEHLTNACVQEPLNQKPVTPQTNFTCPTVTQTKYTENQAVSDNYINSL